jgi:hypothetical protein
MLIFRKWIDKSDSTSEGPKVVGAAHYLTRRRENRNVLFSRGFTYRDFFVDVLTIVVFINWFRLLIAVAGDLFRCHDISGWGKPIWVINIARR